MKKLILGTAGHIDHGKTALVRALTGIDTDRLPEEKQRGITIDLGFANFNLGELEFGVVDVPGHENFIRNMLAGATGMDAVLLVVAADEGVMPQTREHLAILDLLDVRSGVVAISKSDLASNEWLQLVIEDVKALLDGTSIADAPIVPVSARTGHGLDELRAAIVQQASHPGGRPRDDVFRLPVDRVFTIRGTGTVITGTVWSGEVRPDATLRILPKDTSARVRGVQVHGTSVDAAFAGERAAVALAGLDRTEIQRGDVLLNAPWQASRMLTVRWRMIRDTSWQLRTRQRVRVHVGTTEVLARAVVLNDDWVQLRLEGPLVARVGDRVVLRSYSPVTTIAGGEIAEITSRKRTRLMPAEATRLERVLSADAATAVLAVLSDRSGGASMDELTQETRHAKAELEKGIAKLGSDVVAISDRFFSASTIEDAVAALISAAEALHALHPLRAAIELAELRGTVRNRTPALIDRALQLAIKRGDLVASGSSVARNGFRPELTPRQLSLRIAILESLEQAGLAAPTVAELEKNLGDAGQVAAVLRLLEQEGLVRSIAPDLYVDARALAAAEMRTRVELAGVTGLSAADFRTTLPVTRKHLIPLLEYFDRKGVTLRLGDLRSVPDSSVAELREAT